MNEELIQMVRDYDLVNRTIGNAKKHIQKLQEDASKNREFLEYLLRCGFEEDFEKSISKIEFKVNKIRYEIRMNEEDLEAVLVALNLETYDEDDKAHFQLFVYSACYSKEGDFIDDFLDW